METRQPGFSIRKYAVFGFCLILFTLASLYGPLVFRYFANDDFWLLQYAFQNAENWNGIFIFQEEDHFRPVTKAFLALQTYAFGLRPWPYHSVNLLFHLINSGLIGLVFSRFCNRSFFHPSVLVPVALFGLGACHWRTVMWMSTQAQLVTGCFFLLSLFFFLSYVRSGKRKFLIFSACLHLLTLFSFSTGIEWPLFSFLLLFLVPLTGEKWSFRQSFQTVLPFALNTVIYLIIRSVAHAQSASDATGGLEELEKNIPRMIGFLAGGLYHGFLRSFLGTWLAPWTYRVGEGILIFGGLAILFSLQENQTFEGKRALRASAIFGLMAVSLLFLPIPWRLGWGYEAFVTASRYYYLPGIPATLAFSILLINLRPLKKETRPGIFSGLFVLIFSLILFSNISEIRTKAHFLKSQSNRFETLARQYLSDLNSLLGKENRISILNASFSNPSSGYVGYFATPFRVAKLHLNPSDFSKIRFTEPGSSDLSNSAEPVFRVEPGTGKLFPMR